MSEAVREVRLVADNRPDHLGLLGEAAGLVLEGLGFDAAMRTAVADAVVAAAGTLGGCAEVTAALRADERVLRIELRGGTPPETPGADPRLAAVRAVMDGVETAVVEGQPALVLIKNLAG